MLVFRFYAQPMLEKSYEQQAVEGQIYDIVEQTFSAIPVVQAFGREEFNDARFKRSTCETVEVTVSLMNIQMQFKILIGLATAAGTAAILWFGPRHALQGLLSKADILLFLSSLGSLYAPLEAVMY